jgi:hypothetical protein
MSTYQEDAERKWHQKLDEEARREEERRKPKPNGKSAVLDEYTGIVAILASDVKIRAIDFIWKGRLARGKLCCIQ